MKKWIGIALAFCVSTSVFATEEIALFWQGNYLRQLKLKKSIKCR